MFKYFFNDNCFVYDMMWKIMVQPDTEHMII